VSVKDRNPGEKCWVTQVTDVKEVLMGAKILVVDDEPSLLRLTGYSLEIEGYEVITAQTGAEALKKVHTERPDLIVLDVMLPDMNGLEVCRQLRSSPEMVDLPIIMLSARTQVTDRVKGLKSGADEYVTKPFDSDELVARIETLLERARRLRQVPMAKRGKVIGFVGAKGGVGTTTVALNVALALASSKLRTVAVEMTPYFGTFSPQLGMAPDKTLADLLELEPTHITEQELSRRLIQHPTGLHVLFGSQQISETREMSPERAEAIVKGLAGMTDYTILDLRCHPSAASRAALRCCDAVVLVLEPDPACIASGKAALDLFKAWGISEEVIGAVIVNRAGVIVPTLFGEILPEIRSRLGCRIMGVVPPALDLCLKALKVDSHLATAQPDLSFVATMTELAHRLASSEEAVEPLEYAHG